MANNTPEKQRLHMGLFALSNYNFDGSNRDFQCPIGIEEECIDSTRQCQYLKRNVVGLDHCLMPCTAFTFLKRPEKVVGDQHE